MSGKKGKALKSEKDTRVEIEPKKVTFAVWFHRQVKAGKLQFWQEKEISVFFKQKGLSDSEEADKYSELLKLY